MVTDALIDATAGELLAGYRAGDFTPTEALEAVLDRIAALNPQLNAFYVLEPEAAAAAAAQSSRRWAAGEPCGPLDGVPVTLKENIATAGSPTPSGTAALADTPPAGADGPSAVSMSRAGAIRLGKTVMPDYGMLSSGVSSLHGITRSPWHPEWTVGGSSGGASAAATARFGPIHLGSDIGGSIRLPATWTGLASLKPTYALVPVDPPYIGRVIGPLARTIDDVRRAMQIIAVPDPLMRDYTHIDRPLDWTTPPPIDDVRGLRVAVHVDAGAGLPTDPEVAALVLAAAQTFERGGAHVEQIPPFLTQDQLHRLDLFLRARSWLDLTRLDPAHRAAVLPYIEAWAAGAAGCNGSDVIDAYAGVQAMRAATIAATYPYDVVLSPVAPGAAFPAHWHGPTNDPATALEHIAYTAPFNFSEQPAATVNAGFTADGRPVGVQLAGRRFDDVRLLSIAGWYEAARPEGAVPRWPL
ncbi:aspartyl-tRNA(Asn)/glutamyl-tRNA(Gln) amidotransferase subunit A [Kineosphaera limosa]|uniref:Putative amidase n=1 Tax=Kineosphaera limosa NBRC 100340 TaxID=1184609 RepID=K6WM45_9MICO|nr:amidase [Kineosphaera limosa]NYE00958.1 aspartyl-tRNA(Asn)/glutamyl-tRNA(Gln) amidotransferase subunit A [Kineosphaera limosa]GAB94846.1 putative amidase [Kineosphaera limosa NBRC 100340]